MDEPEAMGCAVVADGKHVWRSRVFKNSLPSEAGCKGFGFQLVLPGQQPAPKGQALERVHTSDATDAHKTTQNS